MSATNRGSVRNPYDFYATPINVVENILSSFDISDRGVSILEPSAGNGNISRTIKKYYPNKYITSVEIRESEVLNLAECSNEVKIGDYLTMDIPNKYDIIIGNPPFNNAIEFIKKSLTLLNDDGVLIFLLRTSFLESNRRYDFWQEHPVSGLYALSRRPSFTGSGTDAASYSWFIWDNRKTGQTIKVI